MMKWFKHDSTARNSEKLSALECRTGLEGYGFYFKTLEIVAGLMDSTDKCQASFSPASWARQTNITTKKWLFLAQCCADVGLIEFQCDADVATVRIPKLLKRRDNHTKNLQVGNAKSDKKVSLDKEKEEDKDIDKEKEEKLSSSANAADPCPHEEIISLYHQHLPMMPAVREWTPARQTKLRARWKEKAHRQSLDWWAGFFAYVAESDFLCGRTAKPFTCNLEWLITPSNFAKVIEGNYENRGVAA